MRKLSKIVFFLAIACVLSSCFGVKIAGGGGSTGNLYEEFYTTEGATLYFVNALKYKTKNSQMKVDFTFKDFGSDTTEVNANYTIAIERPEKVKSMTLVTSGGEEYPSIQTSNLFIKNNRCFTSRNTSKYDYATLKKYFSDLGNIKVETDKGMYVLTPKGKTVRKAKKLSRKVFELIDMKAQN